VSDVSICQLSLSCSSIDVYLVSCLLLSGELLLEGGSVRSLKCMSMQRSRYTGSLNCGSGWVWLCLSQSLTGAYSQGMALAAWGTVICTVVLRTTFVCGCNFDICRFISLSLRTQCRSYVIGGLALVVVLI